MKCKVWTLLPPSGAFKSYISDWGSDLSFKDYCYQIENECGSSSWYVLLCLNLQSHVFLHSERDLKNRTEDRGFSFVCMFIYLDPH